MDEVSRAQVFEPECQLSEPVERLRLGHGAVTTDPFGQVAARAVLQDQVVVTIGHLRGIAEQGTNASGRWSG